jgi:hypothetical protein
MLSHQLLSNGFQQQPRSPIPPDAVHTQFREACLTCPVTGFTSTDVNALLAAHGFECHEHTRTPALAGLA